MKLYLEIENGAVQRVVVQAKTETGQTIQLDRKTEEGVQFNVPVALVPAAAWAVSAVAQAKRAHLERALKELGDVPEDKVAEVVAAVEASRPR